MMFLILTWIILSVIILTAVTLREPNVDSVGVKIQEAQFKEVEEEKVIDVILITLSSIFMSLTIYILINY